MHRRIQGGPGGARPPPRPLDKNKKVFVFLVHGFGRAVPNWLIIDS